MTFQQSYSSISDYSIPLAVEKNSNLLSATAWNFKNPEWYVVINC